MAKRKGGRPTKFTKALAAKFCGLLEKGMSRAKASHICCVTPDTVLTWLQKGRRNETPAFAGFLAKVLASEAKFVESRLAEVVWAAKPKRVKVVKVTTRPVFDADGNRVGDATTTETTLKREHDAGMAKWLLECRDRETYGPDRHELAALRKELGELRKLLSARSDGDSPVSSGTDRDGEGDQAGGSGKATGPAAPSVATPPPVPPAADPGGGTVGGPESPAEGG
jgi:hypothetical protein